MKKISTYNLFIFLIGLACLSLGVVLIIKSRLGVSVSMSIPYIFSLHFTKISLGQWNYIIQGISLLILVVVAKKLTVKYLMSFVVAFLFGIAIDLFNLFLVFLEASTFIERIIFFAVGSAVISIGVAALMKSNYPILPFDNFIKEVTFIKKIKYEKFKTVFDLINFTISLTASITFFGTIYGLHIGTLISALILGSMIGACLNFMNKYIVGKSIFPEEKIGKVLDFDFLTLSKQKGVPAREKL